MEKDPKAYTHEVFVGADYLPEELEFLMAIDRYKREMQRPFPTWKEVLDVAKSLGWRKVEHVELDEVFRQLGEAAAARRRQARANSEEASRRNATRRWGSHEKPSK